MKIAIVAAVAANNAIGLDGRLPWSIREDMIHFKKITKGGVLICGRYTAESFQKQITSNNRTIYVVSRKAGTTIQTGINLAKELNKDVFLCGGIDVYKEGLNIAEEIFLTTVDFNFFADRYFPEINWGQWELLSEEKKEAEGGWMLNFKHYKRV